MSPEPVKMHFDRRMLKHSIKQALWRLCGGDDGLTEVTVLSGPAYGTKLRVDVRSESAYWLGSYDSAIVRKIQRLLRSGDTVYDCGAFLGYYSAAMRKSVGAAGQVHVFEASSINYQRVSLLPAMNGWENVFVHHLAVGEAHSHIRFASNLGAASGPIDMPGKNLSNEDLEIEEVACSGIDELIFERQLPPPAFLKLDLETAECFALRNGARTWTELRPTLLIELHRGEDDPPPAFLAAEEFLERFSYSATEAHLGCSVRTAADFLDAEKRGVQCTILAVPRS